MPPTSTPGSRVVLLRPFRVWARGATPFLDPRTAASLLRHRRAAALRGDEQDGLQPEQLVELVRAGEIKLYDELELMLSDSLPPAQALDEAVARGEVDRATAERQLRDIRGELEATS